ncbi:MAG: hypothetical protein GY733_16550 [bacterium]|nr:hypothetical protein [bacterium]
MSGDGSASKQGTKSDARLAMGYWAGVAAIVAGLWLAPAIPTQDGPIHLYNFGLLLDLLTGQGERGTTFRIELSTITNLGLPALGLALSKAMPPWAVERAIVSLHVVLLAWFAASWLRTTGCRVYPAAFVALGFATPWSLFMGFYGFQLASDLALLALVLGWKLRERSLASIATAALSTGAFTLFFHAAPAALLAGLLGLMQLTATAQPVPRRILRAFCVAMPTLSLVAFALAPGEPDSAWVWRDFDYVFVYLATLGTLTFAPQLTACLLVVAAWIVLCLPGERPRGSGDALRFAWIAAAALAGLHLTLPDVAGGGGYLTGRFAWWIPLLLLPAIDTTPTAVGGIKRTLLPTALALLSLSSTLFAALPSARQVAEVVHAAERHPVEGTLTAAIFDRDPRTRANIEPLRHVAAWFVMEGGVLTTNYQARAPFFPVRLSDAARARLPDVDINAAWETDWSRLPIDALVTIDAGEEDRRILTRRFESVWIAQRKRVELWRRGEERGTR